MRTPRLYLRLLLVSSLLLSLAHFCQSAVAMALRPVIRHTVAAVQDEFAVSSVEVIRAGTTSTIHLRANLAAPVYVNGRTFYPLGWRTSERGWYEISMSSTSVVSYGLLTLILAIAWPAPTRRVMFIRCGLALPLAGLLVLLNIAVTFPAELWAPIHDQWIPDISWPLLVGSRMLMDGGGMVLGLLFGIASIIIAGPARPIDASSMSIA